MLGNRQKKACTRAVMLKQLLKTMISEFICSLSNVAPESAGIRCVKDVQMTNVFVDDWKPDFIMLF